MERWLALLLLVLLLSLALPALGNQRIALVIGNNAYPQAPLFNPVNDANAISAALTELGFEVVKATDADLATMQSALLEFTGRIRDGATALVFFAGHGIQANGRNYLVPVDASLGSAGRLRFEALEMAAILEELEYSGSRLNLVILDACRNNPFLGRTRGASGGLAAVDAATGTLIAYATAPGATASDGSRGNGLYTEHLLRALRIPNLQAEEVFKQVRIGVAEYSGGEQVPWESSSLTGDFIFNQRADQMAAVQNPVPSVGPAPLRDSGAETVFWETVRADDRAEGYRAYLNRFPDGVFAALAADRIALLDAALVQGNRCDDLSGAWLDWRGDRDCSSRNFFEADPKDPGNYRVSVNLCAGGGLVGALAGLTAGLGSATARVEDSTLTIDWRHGPCRGITEVKLDAQCTKGSGMIIGQRGGFGSCAGIRETVRLERVDVGH